MLMKKIALRTNRLVRNAGEGGLTGGGLLLILFVVLPLSTILSGYTLTMLWDWFIVTTFGMKSLTIIQAIGVSYVVGFLTFQLTSKDDRSWGEKISYLIARPLVFLAIGWIITLFM